uniref:RRM domain-containing protein n=1 Tax=Panagrolaimus sp. ES5 TaxID=591445 RepID=A0AC34EZE0_9BILA
MVKDSTLLYENIEERKRVKNGKGQDEQYRKVFVGGLSLQTTEEALKEFYSQYGTITDCVVMKDPTTRRSRGFGFVTFTSMDEVDKAMKARPHVIDQKSVDPKRAVPREASQKNEANISTKRLYVSGVRDEHNDKEFQDYFSKYGNVEKVEIIKDKNTGKYRGFAFISFDDYDPVDKCCLERQHMILNHRCDVKKALSKDEISKAQQMDRDRTQRGNRSRGNGRSGGWNERGNGGGNSWGGSSAGGNGGYGSQQGGYGAPPQPWGNNGYPGYGPPAGNGGWNEPASAWGPPQGAGGWQPGPPAPVAGAWGPPQGAGGYPPAPPAQQAWGTPGHTQTGGWTGQQNPRNY